jgi:hypothetical protein
MPKSGAAHSRRTSRHQAFIAEDTAAKGSEKRRALHNKPNEDKNAITHGVKSKFGERNRLLIDARLATGDTRESLLKKAAAIAPLTLRERRPYRG